MNAPLARRGKVEAMVSQLSEPMIEKLRQSEGKYRLRLQKAGEILDILEREVGEGGGRFITSGSLLESLDPLRCYDHRCRYSWRSWSPGSRHRSRRRGLSGWNLPGSSSSCTGPPKIYTW